MSHKEWMMRSQSGRVQHRDGTGDDEVIEGEGPQLIREGGHNTLREGFFWFNPDGGNDAADTTS